MSDEARRLQAEALQHDAAHLLGCLGGAAAAVVHVREDGTLTVACSCGEDVTHPSGRDRYTLQRLTSHMELHATAAERGVPWNVVQAELQRRILR